MSVKLLAAINTIETVQNSSRKVYYSVRTEDINIQKNDLVTLKIIVY